MNKQSNDTSLAAGTRIRDAEPQPHLGHRDRLRRRVAEQGLEGMPPHEILEFLLCYVIPRQNVNELAHALIDHFGSLEGVLCSGVDMLRSVRGVGLRTAQWLTLVGDAVFSCGRLCWEDRPELRNLLQLLRYACQLRQHVSPPCSVQLCLDINDRLLFQRRLTDSRAWGEPMCLRRALADVLENQASGAIILQFVGPMHAEPDEYDVSRAAAYADTLSLAHSSLTDVLIVGEGSISSLRQLGLLTPPATDAPERFLREDYLLGMPDVAVWDADQLRACLEDDPADDPW